MADMENTVVWVLHAQALTARRAPNKKTPPRARVWQDWEPKTGSLPATALPSPSRDQAAGQRLQAALLSFPACVALHKVLVCSSSHLQNVANSAFPREVIQAVRATAGTLRRPGTGQVLEHG